jgi:hypothetical protein
MYKSGEAQRKIHTRSGVAMRQHRAQSSVPGYTDLRPVLLILRVPPRIRVHQLMQQPPLRLGEFLASTTRTFPNQHATAPCYRFQPIHLCRKCGMCPITA